MQSRRGASSARVQPRVRGVEKRARKREVASTPDLALLQSNEPPPVSAELRRLIDAVQADSERNVAKIVAMNHALPELRDIRDDAFWADVEQTTRLNIPLFYRVILDGWSLTEEEANANRAHVRLWVERQISLQCHLTGYRKGMWILWNDLVNDLIHRRPALKGELLVRSVWVLRHFEMVSAAVHQAYYAEREGQARHRHAALRDLFDEIVKGGPSPAAELEARAAALRVDLNATYNLIAAQASPGKACPSAAALASFVARAAGIAGDGVVVVERGRETVLLAPLGATEMSPPAFRSALRTVLASAASGWPTLRAGISGAIRGIDGIRQGYLEARRATEIGGELAPDEIVILYPELAFEDLFDPGSVASRRLVQDALGALLARGASGQRGIATLVAYFRAGGCLKSAAADLGIHPNSLLYRMRQIRGLLALNLDDPEQRLRLEIAVRLLGRSPGLWPAHNAAGANS